MESSALGNSSTFVKFLGVIALMVVSTAAVADDENPTAEWKAPHTAPLYESQAKSNSSAVFGGLGLQLGQSRSLEGGSPGLATAVALQLGYTGALSTWRRYEAGVELISGSASYRLAGSDGEKGTLDWKLGFVLTAGYGASLGNNIWGLWQVGVGSVTSAYSADLPNGRSLAGDKPASGLLVRAGYSILAPVADRGELSAGLRIAQYRTDVSRIKTVSADGSSEMGGGKSITLNIPELVVGLRWKM